MYCFFTKILASKLCKKLLFFYQWRFVALFFLTPTITVGGEIDSLLSRYHLEEGSFAITCISASDCMNCYNGYNVASSYLSNHPEFNKVIVLKGVSNEDIDYFLTKRFLVDRNENTIIIDEELFNFLTKNNSFLSSFVIIHNAQFIYSDALKNLPETLKDVSIGRNPLIPIDSFDITGFTGESSRRFQIVTDSTIAILNYIRLTIDLLNLNKGEIVARFPKPGHEKELMDSIYARIDFTPEQKRFNKKYFAKTSLGKDGYTDPEFTLYNIQTDGNKIYVAMDVTMPVLEINKNEAGYLDSSLGIWRHPMMIILKENLSIDKIINIPIRVPNHKGFFNSLYTFYPNKDELYVSLSGSNIKDSLMAKYKFENSSIHFEQILNVKWPPYFPEKSKRGFPFYHAPNYIVIEKNFYYFFSREPILRSLAKDSIIYLAGWRYSKENSEDHTFSFINKIIVQEGLIKAIGNSGNSFYYLCYSPETHFLLERRLISDEIPFYSSLKENMIFSTFKRENRFLIYRYKV